MPNQIEQELEGLLFEAHVREAQVDVETAHQDMQADFGERVSEDELYHEAVRAVTESGEYPAAVANEVRRMAGLDPLGAPVDAMNLDEYLSWCAAATWKDDV